MLFSNSFDELLLEVVDYVFTSSTLCIVRATNLVFCSICYKEYEDTECCVFMDSRYDIVKVGSVDSGRRRLDGPVVLHVLYQWNLAFQTFELVFVSSVFNLLWLFVLTSTLVVVTEMF